MASSSEIIDLSLDSVPISPASSRKRAAPDDDAPPRVTQQVPHPIERANVPAPVKYASTVTNPVSNAVATRPANVPAPARPVGIVPAAARPKPNKIAKKDSPHALLWICGAGKGQGRQWKQKALKVIGVYSSKEAAERKKDQVMSMYPNCGHGDISVGDSWEDEIDLVVRPVEEVKL